MSKSIKKHNQKYVYTTNFFTNYICYSELHAWNVVKISIKTLHNDVLNAIDKYLINILHNPQPLQLLQGTSLIGLRCIKRIYIHNTPIRFILNHHIQQWKQHECIQCHQHVPQFYYHANLSTCINCIEYCTECGEPITDKYYNHDDLCKKCFSDIIFID